MNPQPSPDPCYLLRGSNSPVTILSYASDDTLFSGSLDGRVHQWSVPSRRTLSTLDAHTGHSVLWICTDHDGELVTQGRDGQVRQWTDQAGTWTCTGEAPCATMGFCSSAVTSLNNTKVIAMPSDVMSQVDIYDIQKQCHVMTLKPDTGQKVGMCMSIKPITNQSENSSLIMTGYENGSIIAWDLRTGKHLSVLHDAHKESIMCMAVSSSSMKGLSGSVDDVIVSWTINDNQINKLRETTITNPGVNDMVIRKDDKVVACAGWDSNIRLFGLKTMKPLAVLSYHSLSAQCVTFSPDNYLACGSKDQLISVWDVYR